MAIRLVHQPIGIGGLAAYAAGRGRAQQRQRKYAADARPRSRVVPEGRFVDPLAIDPAAAEEAPKFFAKGEAEAQRRRDLITQRAQFGAAARAGRMGRKYYGNLLPYFVPQEEIDRRQELADEERQRAFTRERDEAGRAFTLERDAAGFARDDMKSRRRAAEREAAGLRSAIPSWVEGRDRIELEKKVAAVGEFAKPDIDLTDPAAGEGYAGAVASFWEHLEGLGERDPNEAERANTYYRDRTTLEVLPEYREGAVAFDRRTGRPIDVPPSPKDLAAEQALEWQKQYNSTRQRVKLGLYGKENEATGEAYTEAEANKYTDDYMKWWASENPQPQAQSQITRPDARSEYSSARQQQRTSPEQQAVAQPAVPPSAAGQPPVPPIGAGTDFALPPISPEQLASLQKETADLIKEAQNQGAQQAPPIAPLPPGFPAGSQWVSDNIIRLPDGTLKRRKGG